ncbi:hypothetical protein ACH4TY_29835 [Streptomyces anulatus]
MASGEPWVVVPFAVQLAGEYVLEIIDVIGRGDHQRPNPWRCIDVRTVRFGVGMN